PKPSNVHVHDIGAGVEVVSPYRVEQTLLRYGLSRVLHELLEEEELTLGQQHRAQTDIGLAADDVEGHATRSEPGGGRTGCRSKPGPDPGDQLIERKRLGEVVVGPEVEAIHLGVGIAQGGEHN